MRPVTHSPEALWLTVTIAVDSRLRDAQFGGTIAVFPLRESRRRSCSLVPRARAARAQSISDLPGDETPIGAGGISFPICPIRIGPIYWGIDPSGVRHLAACPAGTRTEKPANLARLNRYQPCYERSGMGRIFQMQFLGEWRCLHPPDRLQARRPRGAAKR
jgi:hypothetical protein